MDAQDIKKRLLKSLNLLMSKDDFLLKNNISERAISHKLATYIEREFVEFDTDCEYNGYVEAEKNRKYIAILKQRANELSITRAEEVDDERIYRDVYPDIIVHNRGSNVEGSNLLIVEIKKSTSKIDSSYDEEKLCRYTSKDDGNNLNYKLGAFILLTVGCNKPTYCIDWYEGGSKIDQETVF